MNYKFSWVISVLITLALLGSVGAGYWFGHHRAFFKIRKVVPELNRPTSIHHWVVGDNPDILASSDVRDRYAALYELPNNDRVLVEKTLRNAGWVPIMRPAPFVGSQPSPSSGRLFKINSHGFRDKRTSYIPKSPAVVRVFLTGGSVAFGTGAKSEEYTIARYLENILNQKFSDETGFTYEVINTAVPAWTTTEERILIINRLVDLKPSLIIMLSGNNDVHWALKETEDITDYWSYYVRDFLTILNNAYVYFRFPPAVPALDKSSQPPSCARVAEITRRNVNLAAHAANNANSMLVFALQPNILSTSKGFSFYELRTIEKFGKGGDREKPIWNECYREIVMHLSSIRSPNYRFLVSSDLFSNKDPETEIFLDAYHFSNLGNRLISEMLEKKIDWKALHPN